MMADQGTNRYILYKKRRTKQVKPVGASSNKGGSGTNNYTPMYSADSIRATNQPRKTSKSKYTMMAKGGSPGKGGCGCEGDGRPKHKKIMNHKMGLMYGKAR